MRPATAADHAAVLALNNAHTPHVNALTPDEFAQIVSMSAHFTVAEDPAGLLGFVLCIPQALYDQLHDAAKWPRVALEVNIHPPNPVSVAFHEALGYEAVGTRMYADGISEVQMFIKEIR